MPKLWSKTIAAHRESVRETTLDTAAALAKRDGLTAVTMSQIADEAGIGRATLYKYFPDVGAILAAWHERHVTNHLQQLTDIRDQHGSAIERLKSVLETYAFIAQQRHDTELSTLMHKGEHVVRAQEKLQAMVAELLKQGAKNGDIRDDVSPIELAGYCLHALTAASRLPSKVAVYRLLQVTMAGLRPE